MEYWVLLTIPLARFFEAWRDAIDFALGEKDMPFIWHLLKYPQYSVWFFSGILVCYGNNTIFDKISAVIGGVTIASFTFEVFLRLFRKYHMEIKAKHI